MNQPYVIAAMLLGTLGGAARVHAQESPIASSSADAQPDASRGNRTGWPLGGYDVAATAFNSAERRLNGSNVTDLTVEWVFDQTVAGRSVKAIHATPVVDPDGNTYVGDFTGSFFAV